MKNVKVETIEKFEMLRRIENRIKKLITIYKEILYLEKIKTELFICGYETLEEKMDFYVTTGVNYDSVNTEEVIVKLHMLTLGKIELEGKLNLLEVSYDLKFLKQYLNLMRKYITDVEMIFVEKNKDNDEMDLNLVLRLDKRIDENLDGLRDLLKGNKI